MKFTDFSAFLAFVAFGNAIPLFDRRVPQFDAQYFSLLEAQSRAEQKLAPLSSVPPPPPSAPYLPVIPPPPTAPAPENVQHAFRLPFLSRNGIRPLSRCNRAIDGPIIPEISVYRALIRDPWHSPGVPAPPPDLLTRVWSSVTAWGS